MAICDVAVGALHVICVCADGRLFSWGCNDDGALGRESKGEAACCEPYQVVLPSGVAIRGVACGDCHSCALDSVGLVVCECVDITIALRLFVCVPEASLALGLLQGFQWSYWHCLQAKAGWSTGAKLRPD
eukprot:1762255-Amphidinium_carterae.1